MLHTTLGATLCLQVSMVARQMLASMEGNPRPTRAEMTDVANAVFESADALVLGDETATGKFPVDAVHTMARILANAEEATNYYAAHSFMRDMAAKPFNTLENTASCLSRTSMEADVCAVVTITQAGEVAQTVCKYRPQVPQLVLTTDAGLAAALGIYFGATGICWAGANGAISQVHAAVKHAMDVAAERGIDMGKSTGRSVAVLHGREQLCADEEPVLSIVENLV